MYHFRYYSPIMLVAFYSSEKHLYSITAFSVVDGKTTAVAITTV